MRVFYVDVYFLINFTVDLLSLYFSALSVHLSVSRWRLVLCSAVGAALATAFVLLLDSLFFVLAFSAVWLLLAAILLLRGAGFFRKLRFFVVFFLFELLIGGIVHWGYGALSRVLSNFQVEAEVESRGLLYLSVLILLAIGILRLSMSLLSHSASDKSIEVEIVVGERRYRGSALVDSGNFLKDPMDGAAVVLIKKSVAKSLLPRAFLEEDTARIPAEYQKRLRLIPVRLLGVQRILFGIRPDAFCIYKGEKREQFKVVIAYDKEEGSFGGYSVLIPLVMTEYG